MLKAGDLIQLTDPKGRKHLLTLREGATFHTHRGALSHDDIIGGPDGNVVRSIGGTPYVIFRPLLADYTLAMKRGAAVVYPKDAAQIVAFADVFPGARVLEAILAGTEGSRQRGTLLAQLEAGTDPRVERYWQLTAVITGREPFSSQAPLKWLAAALRAQHEQGR